MTLKIETATMVSVWQTVESYCLCRDFKYNQYLEVQAKHSKSSPASKEMYAELGLVFFNEMTRSYD